jgi:Tfp pilus assembly protein PilF
MLLQRFSELDRSRNSRFWIAPVCLCLAFVGGCAAGPDTQQSANSSPADAGHTEIREIPPQATTMYEQAVAIMATGDTLEAQLRFQEFLLQYPEYPGAHVNLAIIYARNGNDQATEGSLTDALIIAPEHPEALNQLGMLLRRQGKFDAAESAYTRALAARPDYALAHYNLGVLNELYLQRLDVALLHFETYQSLTGEDKQVEKWIVDLKRRVQANQRTANVTE